MLRFGRNSAVWCRNTRRLLRNGRDRNRKYERLVFQNGSSYISAMNWDMSTKFGLLIDNDLLKTVTSTNRKPKVVLSGRCRHHGKSIWPHISAVGGLIWMKFGSPTQNSMAIAVIWPKSKPEVEFHGGRLFFQKRRSYISAVIWDMSTKYGVLIDIDLLKKVTSPNPKPEVKLRHSGRHLENR